MHPDGGAPAPSSEAWKVARLLELDRAAIEVCTALPNAILLKGPTFAQWLYAESPRARLYTDVDVLASVNDAHDRALEGLGFERSGHHPLGIHTTWIRPSDNVTVELHSSLLGILVEAEIAVAILSKEVESFNLAGARVTQLNEQARALHVCLHAAGDGDAPQPLEDLRRACGVSDMELWMRVSALAKRLDAVDALSTGLAAIPEGLRIACMIDLPANRSVSMKLRASGASNAAQALGLIDDARGARAKGRVLMQVATTKMGSETGIDARPKRFNRMAQVLRAIPEWWRARRSLH